MTDARRGFPEDEFARRARAAQAMMEEEGLAALLLTTEPELRYYTGFLTRFWESPTRPWFLVLPATGKPIAVIPGIGAHLMGRTWVEDIRTWQAPDLADDGIGLLAETLREVAPKGAAIGLADGMESHVRMPRAGLRALETLLENRRIAGDGAITRRLRMVKSPAEIAKIRTAAGIADRAFGRVSEVACAGVPLERVFREFQALCLAEGADWVPYLAGGAGPGGYHDVISPADDRSLAPGDVLMLDTGLVWDGYFCDFDRNFSLGRPAPALAEAHARLVDATAAAASLARPGRTLAELFHAMQNLVDPKGEVLAAGRFGHGLGMQLTEWPSILPDEHTPLVDGMVLTLEPCVPLADGRLMVHEEIIVVRETGAEWLSEPQSSQMRCL